MTLNSSHLGSLLCLALGVTNLWTVVFFNGARTSVRRSGVVRRAWGVRLRECPPLRPRAADSSLISLRHTPQALRPCGLGFLIAESPQFVTGSGRWGILRSGIKEELSALGRRGGQPRSRVPCRPDSALKGPNRTMPALKAPMSTLPVPTVRAQDLQRW